MLLLIVSAVGVAWCRALHGCVQLLAVNHLLAIAAVYVCRARKSQVCQTSSLPYAQNVSAGTRLSGRVSNSNCAAVQEAAATARESGAGGPFVGFR
jgi:hypothetical protein